MTEPRVVTVTPAQRAVVGELALDGASNPVIARRLRVSEDTVKTHIRRALAAANADNRTHLVCLLLRGLVQVRVEDGRARR